MSLELVNIGVGVLNVVVTGFVAYAVQRGSAKVVTMEQDRAIKDAWVEIDQVALSNAGDMRLLDAMFAPDGVEDSEEERRKRWLAYMVLNPLEAAWSAARKGHMPDGALSSSEESMQNLVRDPGIHALIQRVVYDTQFKARCAELRTKWLEEEKRRQGVADQASRPPSTLSTEPVT